MGVTVAHLFDSDPHGRVFFTPQRHFNGIFHGDHFGHGNHSGSRVRKRCNGLGQADQQQMGTGVFVQKLATGRQNDTGPVIASHTVDSDCHHHICARNGFK
jgi:hypothetical protein